MGLFAIIFCCDWVGGMDSYYLEEIYATIFLSTEFGADVVVLLGGQTIMLSYLHLLGISSL